MTRPRPVPSALAHGPFNRSTALAHVTRSVLAGPSFQRLTQGAHCQAGVPINHGTRILAARQVLPPIAVLGGLSAMWAFGIDHAETTDRVEIVLPHERRVRRRPELRVRGDHLGDGEVVPTPLGLATSPARTAFDLARRGRPEQVVPHLDALVAKTGVSAEEVLAVVSAHPGVRGVRLVAGMLELVDPGAGSIRESKVRLLFRAARLPVPVTQYPIYDASGRFIGRVDFAWPDQMTVLEYDGEYHDAADQIAADRVRLNRMRACGWQVIVADRHQFAHPDELIRILRSLLQPRG